MNRRTSFDRVARGATVAVAATFVGAWLAFPILLPIEELLVAATTPGLRFHPPAMTRFYIRQMRLIDPQYRTDEGLTLLQFVLNGYRRGGDPEINRRCLEIAEFLIKRGVPLDVADTESGLTALHQAIVNGEPQVVEFLLDHGASPTLPVGRGGPLGGKTPDDLARLQLEGGKLNAGEVAAIEKKLKLR